MYGRRPLDETHSIDITRCTVHQTEWCQVLLALNGRCGLEYHPVPLPIVREGELTMSVIRIGLESLRIAAVRTCCRMNININVAISPCPK